MPKPKPVTPKVKLTLWLPLELRANIDLMLASELEGRVPHGEYAKFFEQLLRDYLDSKTINLSLYGFPPGYYVRGPKEMAVVLETALKEQHLGTIT